MDFKTYMKNTYENVCNFNRVFNPWLKWKNVKLSDICPCNTCEVSIELRKRQYEVQMSGGLQEEIMKPCEHCMDSTIWKMECLEKLHWYEDNDDNLKT